MEIRRRPRLGLPRRFRVDASEDPEFASFTSLAVFTDSDYPNPGIAPFAIRTRGHNARYVRVTVTKFAGQQTIPFL